MESNLFVLDAFSAKQNNSQSPKSICDFLFSTSSKILFDDFTKTKVAKPKLQLANEPSIALILN